MSLVCLGLSHRTAPAEVRERHAFPPARMTEALVALRDYDSGARSGDALDLQPARDLRDADRRRRRHHAAQGVPGQLPPRQRSPTTSTRISTRSSAAAAVEHFLRVSTGLDSMLIGEAEILGQVKEAYQQAQLAQSLGTTLHRLFREALNAGKSGAFADRDRQRLGQRRDRRDRRWRSSTSATLNGKNILLVGAGRWAQTAAKRLKLEGAARLVVVNRTPERARELVARLGIGEARRAALAGRRADDGRRRDHVDRRVALRPDAAQRRRSDARRDRAGRCSSSTSPSRATSIPKSRRSPASDVADIDQLGATVDVTLEQRRKRFRSSKRSSPNTSPPSMRGIDRGPSSRSSPRSRKRPKPCATPSRRASSPAARTSRERAAHARDRGLAAHHLTAVAFRRVKDSRARDRRHGSGRRTGAHPRRALRSAHLRRRQPGDDRNVDVDNLHVEASTGYRRRCGSNRGAASVQC